MAWYDHLTGSNFEYPQCEFFIPAKSFVKSSGMRTIKSIVIHITGGPATDERGAINQFIRDTANSSAHYIVNRNGNVFQCVKENDIAHHAGPENPGSVGIEHVNRWNSSNKDTPTEMQYQASAKLVKYLCFKFGIPIVHTPYPNTSGIKGHVEADPSTSHKDCPNAAWDWNKYIDLVRKTSAPST